MSETPPATFPTRVAIVGVGLLGGSVARSLRRWRTDIPLVGISRTESTRETAMRLGVVDEAFDSIEQGCVGCDAVVICTPVSRIARQVLEAAEVTSEHCLITDVGSTKAGIVNDVAASAKAASKFVAAHPIAGSEKTGVANATADLFDEKVIVLTPTDFTTDFRHRQAEAFWRLTGGRCFTMTPQQHDEQLALVSHMPHVLSALVAAQASPDALSLVGSGWRDTTRVAAGDPNMWAAICLENGAEIVNQLQRCGDQLARVGEMIRDRDHERLQDWFAQAQAIRQSADEDQA